MRQLLLACLLLSTAALGQQPAHRHHAPQAAARPAPVKELAYYCASGNVVKYHSSPDCRGLTRCLASVQPLALALAEAQGRMEPCKICH